MTTSVAEETGNASSAGNNRAHSNGGSGKDKCSDGKTLTARGRVFSKKPICHGYGYE